MAQPALPPARLEASRLLAPTRKEPAIEAMHWSSVTIVLFTVASMYSVHNLVAPNLTTIARIFHFDDAERDAYVGGELAMCFYLPGVLGALLAGILSGLMQRKLLLAALSMSTGLACLLSGRVTTFGQLLCARAVSGFSIGGALPVVYSLVGDWFPACRRAGATARVAAASGCGVFAGQCLATLTDPAEWRWPFLIVAGPCIVMGTTIFWFIAEPVRGGQEMGSETLSLCRNAGLRCSPSLGVRHLLRASLLSRTNTLVILQAFPGNLPWGVILVYFHDFLVQDIGLSRRSALGAISALAASAFAGVLAGGFVGELLYRTQSRHLALFGGLCNIVRAVPFFLLFGWKRFFGPVTESSELAFAAVLVLGGLVATMASPCTGAILLNVNLPESRGSVIAMYAVLDDVSKGFGAISVSALAHLTGGRALAYQLSLLIWVFTGAALLCAWRSYDADEQRMRAQLEEATVESMVIASKHQVFCEPATKDNIHQYGAAATTSPVAAKGPLGAGALRCGLGPAMSA
mmetsp:Transcript_107331/g.308882  ORF Transcript_107331/g.308882 Transcript_107331/m.308882 type:complete len:519 (+) Transcript_107331:200-1756(+)